MYSVKSNVLQLVALMQAHGIKHVVLCPGSRNIPLVQTLASCPSFQCYRVTDERSAGFFALGIALEKREAVAVCCTSGSALLNIHPAVCEAFYQQVPLLVLSGDRAAAWIGQMDGQTLPQDKVFGSLVRAAVTLPEIHEGDATEAWFCNRLINEALLELNHKVRGPVHINVPLDEPLFDFSALSLPAARVFKRFSYPESSTAFVAREYLALGYSGKASIDALAAQIIASGTSLLIVLGQGSGDILSELDPEELKLLRQHVLIATEHLANTPHYPCVCSSLDTLLAVGNVTQAPDLVITLGGHFVSKRLKKFLRAHHPKRHWHIAPDGAVVDIFQNLTTVIEGNPQRFLCDFCKALASASAAFYTPDHERSWAETLHEAAEQIPEPEFVYGQIGVLGQILHALPENSVLHLANSSTVRYAQLFSLSEDIEVNCNRGVNGIEGSLSAAMGYAAASSKLNFIMIGDLSFFYDMNALWQPQLKNNVRIVLFNNGNGEIFSALPKLEFNAKTKAIITAEHETSAKAWAESCALSYAAVRNQDDLERVLPILTSADLEQPLLVEVFSDSATDIQQLKGYYASAAGQEETTQPA